MCPSGSSSGPWFVEPQQRTFFFTFFEKSTRRVSLSVPTGWTMIVGHIDVILWSLFQHFFQKFAGIALERFSPTPASAHHPTSHWCTARANVDAQMTLRSCWHSIFFLLQTNLFLLIFWWTMFVDAYTRHLNHFEEHCWHTIFSFGFLILFWWINAPDCLTNQQCVPVKPFDSTPIFFFKQNQKSCWLTLLVGFTVKQQLQHWHDVVERCFVGKKRSKKKNRKKRKNRLSDVLAALFFACTWHHCLVALLALCASPTNGCWSVFFPHKKRRDFCAKLWSNEPRTQLWSWAFWKVITTMMMMIRFLAGKKKKNGREKKKWWKERIEKVERITIRKRRFFFEKKNSCGLFRFGLIDKWVM